MRLIDVDHDAARRVAAEVEERVNRSVLACMAWERRETAARLKARFERLVEVPI
jgi:hypothetical protein